MDVVSEIHIISVSPTAEQVLENIHELVSDVKRGEEFPDVDDHQRSLR